jgi:hypothetical protein
MQTLKNDKYSIVVLTSMPMPLSLNENSQKPFICLAEMRIVGLVCFPEYCAHDQVT